jgi:hypothetical protein
MPRAIRNEHVSSGKGIAYWRERWLHEDDLINHRLTWLLVAQTILFAGCAPLLDLLFDSEKKLKGCNREIVLFIVQSVFPWVGFGIAVSIGVGIAGAIIAMCFIHHYANKERGNTFEYGVHWLPSILGQLAGGFLPVLFAVTWYSLIGVFSKFS